MPTDKETENTQQQVKHLFCVVNEREIFACVSSLIRTAKESVFYLLAAEMLNVLIDHTNRS
jgi:hypothetical protein